VQHPEPDVKETLAGKFMRAPFTGTITRFRVEGGFGSGGIPSRYRLLVLRKRKDGYFKAIRQTGEKTADLVAPEVASFPVRLPIRKGNFIGLSLLDYTSQVGVTETELDAQSYYCAIGFLPALAVGMVSQSTPGAGGCGNLVLYNAKLVR
jgi:hypothetical protein